MQVSDPWSIPPQARNMDGKRDNQQVHFLASPREREPTQTPLTKCFELSNDICATLKKDATVGGSNTMVLGGM